MRVCVSRAVAFVSVFFPVLSSITELSYVSFGSIAISLLFLFFFSHHSVVIVSIALCVCVD